MDTEKTNRLLNRVVIVSGAGSQDTPNNPDSEIVGNGRATSILLARAGALVVLADLNLDSAKRTQKLIESAPPEFSHGKDRTIAIRADVANEKDCEAVIRVAVAKWSRIDILVNSVGIGGQNVIAVDVDVEQWRKEMDVNVLGMVLMSKYAIPEMLRTRPDDISKGTGKAIVNVSSIAGLVGGVPGLAYPTAKGAIISMTRAMATHHGPDGIRVNCVAPGTVFTPMVVGEGMSEHMRALRKNSTLLGIEGYGWDVANAIVFLASDEARWITGIVLPVDAGRTAGLPMAGMTLGAENRQEE